MKKLTAMLLALLLAGSMTACSSVGTQESSDPGSSSAVETSDVTEKRDVGGLQLPLCDETQELSVWTVYNNNSVPDPNDLPGIQELERRTNVHVNWIPVATAEVQEKVGILFSSGDFPDIVYPASYGYTGGLEKGVQDGVIADMDTLIRENMPNYMAILNSNEQARREATSDDGKLLAVYVIVGTDTTIESEGTYMGLAYRKDLFDAMDMELPETVSGWYDVLVKAKESGMSSPFLLSANGGSNLSLAYGVTTSGMDSYLQLDGDSVVSAAMQDGFGQYLEEMRKWYEEGLIDPNFTSGTPMTTMDFSSIENGSTLLYDSWNAFVAGDRLYAIGNTTNPDVYMQPITNPVLQEGDQPVQSFRRVIAKDPIYITTACEVPELAAQWLDYWWSDEGTYLSWYGIEGESYEIGEDGTPQYTDTILHNEEGLSPQDALYQYAFNSGSWLGKHDITATWKLSDTGEEGATNIQQYAQDIWSAPETNIHITESLAFTDAEGVELSSLQTAVNTMIEEYMVNYITGNSNTSFDEFRENLKTYGVERICEIYQSAYDRYLAR